MIQFPINPILNQEYSFNQKSWIWDGVSWNLKPFQETDPVFNSSQAKNITSAHITVLNNTSGINTGDQDLTGLVPYIGIANLNTDPLQDALSLNHNYPGIYILSTVGDYLNFNISVSEEDIKNSIIYAVPNINNGNLVNYDKILYKINIQEPVFPDNTITSSSLAKLPANSNISGKTALEVLDLAINAELFPTTLMNPSVTFNIAPFGLQIVGNTVNVTKTRSFSRGSISPQYLSESPYRSGELVDYTEVGDEGSFLVPLGTTTWSCKANYLEGVQPKGSKGTNYSTPLPAGSTSIVTATIIGVYPVFATISNISIMSQLPVALHGSEITVSMVADSDTEKQRIKIPVVWGNISTLQQHNTFSDKWDTIDLSTFTKTSVIEVINGFNVDYYLYVYNGNKIGTRQLKFKL